MIAGGIGPWLDGEGRTYIRFLQNRDRLQQKAVLARQRGGPQAE